MKKSISQRLMDVKRSAKERKTKRARPVIQKKINA